MGNRWETVETVSDFIFLGSYKCDLCGKWHIGHNGKKLFNDDKNKYKEKLSIFNFVKKIKR